MANIYLWYVCICIYLYLAYSQLVRYLYIWCRFCDQLLVNYGLIWNTLCDVFVVASVAVVVAVVAWLLGCLVARLLGC